MHIFRLSTILLIATLSFSVSLFGQNKSDQFDALLTKKFDKKAFNGNVLIAEKGKIVFEKSYGLADEAKKLQLTTSTVFELASVSKQFTAMAILLLQKQGKLKLEDKLSKYIPELSFYGDITIDNLVHHTSGLPDYMDLFEEKWDKSKFATNESIISEFAKYQPALVFQTNSQFEYSNTGYAFLGTVIERASGKSYGEFLQEVIFKPLKMTNTSVYRRRFEPRTISDYAHGYYSDSLGNKFLPDSLGKEFYIYYLDGIVGDGMVNSTLGDLLKWDRALYGTKFVTEADKKLIFNSVKTTNGKETGYGFGWLVETDAKYGKIVSHSGGWGGYVNYIERHLDSDKTIILLQNNALETTEIPVIEIRKILYNEKVEALTPITLKSEDLDKYLGVYASAAVPIKITITKEGTQLKAEATGQGMIPLDSYENHIFKFDPAEVKLTFNPTEKTMSLNQRGMETLFTKE